MMPRISVLLPTPLRPSAHDLAGPDLDAHTLEHVARGVTGGQILTSSSAAIKPAPDRCRHVLVRRDLVHRPFREDPALVQHGHPLRHLADEGDVVLDHDDGEPGPVQVLEHPCRLQGFLGRGRP